MIIAKDINPEHSLYYIGSLIIKELTNSNAESIDFMEVYRKLHNNQQISLNIFTLSLDWLFLNSAVEIKNGEIKKCF